MLDYREINKPVLQHVISETFTIKTFYILQDNHSCNFQTQGSLDYLAMNFAPSYCQAINFDGSGSSGAVETSYGV